MTEAEGSRGEVGPTPFECVVDLHDAGDGVTVDVTGEIDQATRDLLATHLFDAISAHPTVFVDLTKVSFMDSWGLSAVLAARARAAEQGVEFGVSAASRQVAHLFDITGVGIDFGWPTVSSDGGESLL